MRSCKAHVLTGRPSLLSTQFGAGKSKTLWNRIKRICARTIIPILPLLAREYESTFKLADQQQPPYASVPHPPATAAEGTDGDSRTPPPDVKGSRCFEVLGFDIMVQANMQPRLIEVNHLPRSVRGGLTHCDASFTWNVFVYARFAVSARTPHLTTM